MMSSIARLLGQPSCGRKRVLVGVLAAATVAGVAFADPKPATQNLKPD